ncbi:MAG: hypothetical protein HOP33_12100 [Verrucomicrobia bacterium]|nr:hypothetical protein [Verrucomicrobiota bacterium]
MSWLVGGHGCPLCLLMHGRGIIICTLLSAGVLLAGTPGYLARVGPADLRFEVDTSTLPDVPLPPLPAAETSQSGKSDTATPDETAPEVTPEANTDPVVPVSASPELPPAESSSTNTPITPQMFIEFFKPDAAGTKRETIIVPNVEFSPARSSQSSKATFTQPKK